MLVKTSMFGIPYPAISLHCLWVKALLKKREKKERPTKNKQQHLFINKSPSWKRFKLQKKEERKKRNNKQQQKKCQHDNIFFLFYAFIFTKLYPEKKIVSLLFFIQFLFLFWFYICLCAEMLYAR